LSLVTGAADAAIYAGEGALVGAGVAATSMILGGKIVTTAGKVIKEFDGVPLFGRLLGRCPAARH
jgi:hypothetical protein